MLGSLILSQVRNFKLPQMGKIKLPLTPKPIRELRDLCRYRKKLTEQASAEKNRVQKVLEDANIKLASVATGHIWCLRPGNAGRLAGW